MKNKIFGLTAGLIIAVVAAVNVSLNLHSQKNELSDVSLINLEASANLIEDISDWWNSKVYVCYTETCSKTYGFPIWQATYYGTYSNCISGSSYAHCWECDSACNAY
jgi:hypothetical protein